MIQLGEPSPKIRDAYLHLDGFFEDGVIIIFKNFPKSCHIFAFGDTLCVYDDIFVYEDTGDLSRIPEIRLENASAFVSDAAACFADLMQGGFLFRGYVALGDMYEIDPFRKSEVRSLFRNDMHRIRMATSIGTALVRAVELAQRSINCAGLFTYQSTAEELQLATIEGATIQYSRGPRIVLVDLSAYMDPDRYRRFVEHIAVLAQDEPTDDETLSEWFEVHWSGSLATLRVGGSPLSEAEQRDLRNESIERERLLRVFRNRGRDNYRNLLGNLQRAH